MKPPPSCLQVPRAHGRVAVPGHQQHQGGVVQGTGGPHCCRCSCVLKPPTSHLLLLSTQPVGAEPDHLSSQPLNGPAGRGRGLAAGREVAVFQDLGGLLAGELQVDAFQTAMAGNVPNPEFLAKINNSIYLTNWL